MWARALECLVAVWLFLSPRVLPYFVHEKLLQNSHLVVPFLIVIFSLFSFHSAFRKIHLVNFLLGAWLLGLGYIAYPLDPLPSQENSVVVGLLIMLFSLIPRGPSLSWQQFFQKKELTFKRSGTHAGTGTGTIKREGSH